MQNKTKIICTLSNMRKDKDLIRDLINSGMNVVRLNFSHTNPQESKELVDIIKTLRCEMNVPLSIMLDTKGPEVRIYGHKEKVQISKNDELVIESYINDDIETVEISDNFLFYTNLPSIGNLVKINDRILLMDGFIEGNVIEKSVNMIKIKIKNNGSLRNKAHLSIPKVDYPLPFLSKKDKEDISFAVKENLEYIALSFVRSSEDLFNVKSLIKEINPNSKIKIISKIENQKAVDNIDEIIKYSDGIMVARGDLGVQLDLEEVPIIQKKIIEKCYLSGKPVITATQMLESMIDNPMPTRAEVSDVANACFDMTSAVMLSGETAIGNFPVLAVETMSKIIKSVEDSIDYKAFLYQKREFFETSDLTTIISYNAVSTAYQCKASAILDFTKTGYSARIVSKLRPKIPIYAFTYDPDVYNQLSINWGVIPVLIEEEKDFELMIKNSLELALKENFIKKGDLVVIVAGLPMGKEGSTNMIRVEGIGKSKLTGKFINKGYAKSNVVYITNKDDLDKKDLEGKILFLKYFKKECIPMLKTAAGIVTENYDYEQELSLVGIAYDIPIMIGVKDLFDIIAEGALIEINSKLDLLIEF